MYYVLRRFIMDVLNFLSNRIWFKDYCLLYLSGNVEYTDIRGSNLEKHYSLNKCFFVALGLCGYFFYLATKALKH